MLSLDVTSDIGGDEGVAAAAGAGDDEVAA